MALSQPHRPSALKQQNKKHNTLGHRTKGALSRSSKGRVSVKTLSKKARKELSRQERRNRSKQIRAQKREEATARKRALGSASSPPFLVSVVPLSPSINPRKILNALISCDKTATATTSSQGIIHLSSSRYKQRYSFVVPPVNDLYAVLDSIKVSDTLMLLWPGDEEIGEASDLLLSSILAQGLPVPVHVLSGLDDMAQKKKHVARQNVIREIELRFPGTVKLHSIEREQDALLVLRQIGAQKQRPIFFRDNRPHIMAEKVEFHEEGSSGTLKVHGYIRGRVLSVNGLVHIPGWGEYQMSRIDTAVDPHPLENRGRGKQLDIVDEETHLLEEADPNLQEDLTSTNEVDPLEGEQTWPTEEELREAEENVPSKPRIKRVPKGTSDYQAAWILENDDEESVGDEESESDMDDEENLAPVDIASQDGYECEEGSDEEDSEEYETVTVSNAEGNDYDEKVDYDAEMDDLQKMQSAREDKMFPDEVDTPQNIPARIRFQKFRGLQSFRASPWDPSENLPVDYSRIFQFENFQRTRKRVIKDEREGALPGWYVVIHISEIPRYMYDSHVASRSPLVIFGLLPHEQKMSVINVVIKSHSLGHFQAIKSKERLIFHIGFRRFANAPIFSEHSTGNKHKFARYFHPGATVVATMFAPVTFPPASVTVFRERPDGAQDLVATGSVLSAEPKRIVVKRLVLSGHPFKVNRKTAVVRYMFFNREDILWFKPLELRTKWGRRGHIKEPLGTHGHMKCHFDGQLKSQDTVLLNLYKRIFPKWKFDPHVARPPPLYTFHSSSDVVKVNSDSEEDISEQQPAPKKAKTVTFFTSRP